MKEVASRSTEAYIIQVLRHGFLHADPHSGEAPVLSLQCYRNARRRVIDPWPVPVVQATWLCPPKVLPTPPPSRMESNCNCARWACSTKQHHALATVTLSP